MLRIRLRVRNLVLETFSFDEVKKQSHLLVTLALRLSVLSFNHAGEQWEISIVDKKFARKYHWGIPKTMAFSLLFFNSPTPWDEFKGHPQ